MNRRGILTILSGFSGSGKGTLVKRLMEEHDEYALSISATTRKPREGEEDGVAYFFRTREEFEEMIRKDELLEYARYVENYYGTPKTYVEEKLLEGKDVILEIEIQGALQIKAKRPDTLMLFVTPPNAKALKERLTGRGTETEEVILSRLSRAAKESEGIEQYDYLIINDDLETCVEEMHQIIQKEHFRTSRNQELIETIREDMKRFVKGD